MSTTTTTSATPALRIRPSRSLARPPRGYQAFQDLRPTPSRLSSIFGRIYSARAAGLWILEPRRHTASSYTKRIYFARSFIIACEYYTGRFWDSMCGGWVLYWFIKQRVALSFMYKESKWEFIEFLISHWYSIENVYNNYYYDFKWLYNIWTISLVSFFLCTFNKGPHQ